jgi:hypothetical protein
MNIIIIVIIVIIIIVVVVVVICPKSVIFMQILYKIWREFHGQLQLLLETFFPLGWYLVRYSQNVFRPLRNGTLKWIK